MKIVVIGGTGRVGAEIVAQLMAAGHEAIAASRSTGVNTLTGEGLADALAGADVLIDASNSPSFEDEAVLRFFQTSTGNLLAAATAAGVKHYVALGVVGTQRLSESGYFRAKIAQEEMVKGGSVPYTIVRATQFFELVPVLVDAATDGDTVRVPPILIQPMSSADASRIVADVALGAPINGTVEIAGPEQLRIDELFRAWLSARQDSRMVVVDPQTRFFGASMHERTLVAGDGARRSETRFADWLKQPA